MRTDILFWGENFAFEDLVDVKKVGFNVYEEETKSKKDKKKLVGTAEIEVSGLQCGLEVERWHPMTLIGTKGNEGQSMRLKLKYQKVSILPLKAYKDLLEYLRTNYMTVCEILEPVVSVKAKDDIAQVLLRILQACGIAKEFLVNLVIAEINSLGKIRFDIVNKQNYLYQKKSHLVGTISKKISRPPPPSPPSFLSVEEAKLKRHSMCVHGLV